MANHNDDAVMTIDEARTRIATLEAQLADAREEIEASENTITILKEPFDLVYSAARESTLEEAAKVAEGYAGPPNEYGEDGPMIAAAIRALKPNGPQG